MVDGPSWLKYDVSKLRFYIEYPSDEGESELGYHLVTMSFNAEAQNDFTGGYFGIPNLSDNDNFIKEFSMDLWAVERTGKIGITVKEITEER
jgi:hypothetical protein